MIDLRKGGDAYRDPWSADTNFANGGYGGKLPQRTARRCAEVRAGGAEVLNLCPAAPGSEYWKLWVWPWIDAVAWLGRLSFVALVDQHHSKTGALTCKAGKIVHGNRTEIAMCYAGDDPDRFALLYGGAGFPVQVVR